MNSKIMFFKFESELRNKLAELTAKPGEAPLELSNIEAIIKKKSWIKYSR